MFLHWSGLALPDVHDFDDSAFAGAGTGSPRRAQDEAPFAGEGPGPLPFRVWEDAICF